MGAGISAMRVQGMEINDTSRKDDTKFWNKRLTRIIKLEINIFFAELKIFKQRASVSFKYFYISRISYNDL